MKYHNGKYITCATIFFSFILVPVHRNLETYSLFQYGVYLNSLSSVSIVCMVKYIFCCRKVANRMVLITGRRCANDSKRDISCVACNEVNIMPAVAYLLVLMCTIVNTNMAAMWTSDFRAIQASLNIGQHFYIRANSLKIYLATKHTHHYHRPLQHNHLHRHNYHSHQHFTWFFKFVKWTTRSVSRLYNVDCRMIWSCCWNENCQGNRSIRRKPVPVPLYLP
jgi:hypothetical protein